MPPLRGINQSGPFCLLIGPKQTNLVEDVEILLPVKLHWNPFSGFKGEVKNVSTNQKPFLPYYNCKTWNTKRNNLFIQQWRHHMTILVICCVWRVLAHPGHECNVSCINRSQSRQNTQWQHHMTITWPFWLSVASDVYLHIPDMSVTSRV